MSDISMLVEKKSLRRFLLVYIFSTLLLLGIGAFFYYKVSYQSLLDIHINIMKQSIDTFMFINQKKRFLRTGATPDYQDNIPIATYVNSKFYVGNFEPKNIHLEKEYYMQESKLYYINKEFKRFGEIHFVTYSDISKSIVKLQKSILLFLLLSTIFILLVAVVLGKIFIHPMKETIVSLENFIADATHEINTPISTILINVEMTKELYPELSNTEEYQKIKTSAERLSKIFKDLSFARLNHKQQQKLENLKLDELLRERITFFKTHIDNKYLTISTEIDQKNILVDKEDMIRIIDNLISNAIKYSPPNEHIFISLKECLKIQNKGQIKNKKNILKKYQRENISEGGFGLGLHIIEKICKRYGFVFTIENSGDSVIVKICMPK